MSLIEQAAKRLEQLRQAGVELPEDQTARSPAAKATVAVNAPDPYTVDISQAPRAGSDTSPQEKQAVSRAPSPPSKRVELNLESISASGLLVPQASRSQLADEYRVIKRPLIANAMGKGSTPIENGNLIMVTSALPGEGKSFTAINLAISIAMELDNTVMLVDADVSRPSVLNMLGLPPAPGLLDVVSRNSVDISGVLLRTNIEKLSILPSGTQHPRATELLASDAMVRLLDDMSSRYSDRIIIFDSPPLLLTTESRALAAHMGQIIIVVNAESTAQAAVKQAIAAIDACPVKMMLLNQARQASTDGYGYGYGYGYGHEN
ncbi:XrtA-associated tyrosine autokinase [Dechloromonas denitrificans]|uniref:XrtA-associated tyrosine autokinase n=1 Tax=Dechloromonas denitrificans TaxID=281362 RepID=UPI001CF85506|nr:XrtA-associated tyrosine autokinase [Dechloromonas denitrificans]UCV01920.1 XrtA-associated tyrosine autokinase [Dechloromonas denitrificans]